MLLGAWRFKRFRIRTVALVLVLGLALASFLTIPPLPNLHFTRPRLWPTRHLAPAMVYSTKSTAEPKLSAREEREWNHMAEGMEYYHNHFRHSFDSIYEVSLLLYPGRS